MGLSGKPRVLGPRGAFDATCKILFLLPSSPTVGKKAKGTDAEEDEMEGSGTVAKTVGKSRLHQQLLHRCRQLQTQEPRYIQCCIDY